MGDDGDFRQHYALGLEKNRLVAGVGLLERLRTEESLRRCLPRPPAVVLDVGGGPGLYATWLVYHLTAREYRPDELRAEVADAWLEAAQVLAVEGPLWLLSNLEEDLRDIERRERLPAPRRSRG